MGLTWGLVVLGTTPLVVFLTFLGVLACSVSFGGLLEEGRILARLASLSTSSLETISALGLEVLEGPEVQMAGG